MTIGDELDVGVLAEGVETAEQLQAVREAGCSLVQGALSGLPSPSRPGTRAVRAQLLRR